MKGILLYSLYAPCWLGYSFFLLQISETMADVNRCDYERSGKFSKKQTDSSLQHHVIQILEVNHLAECSIACVDHVECKSYNFEETENVVKSCELSSSTKESSSSDVITRAGYQYHDAYYVPPCEDPKALGMESGTISDEQITASTEHTSEHGARNARLNFAKGSGSWSALVSPDFLNQWLQVDFNNRAIITDIMTQGRYGYSQWVESYTVSYSDDGLNFITCKEDGEDKVFIANIDRSTVVTNTIEPVIFARFVRIHPKSWSRYISMRVEFNGCVQDKRC